MPLNLPPQTSLFFEREVICQLSIIEKWPHRNSAYSSWLRWCILEDVKALRSMRGANVEYLAGLSQSTIRAGGRTKRKQLRLI